MWRALQVWVVGVVLPGYTAACLLLTLAAMSEGGFSVLFAVVGLAIWMVVAASVLGIAWGTQQRLGVRAWAARCAGWSGLLACSIPFVSVSFVTWPLLLTALPVLLPAKRASVHRHA